MQPSRYLKTYPFEEKPGYLLLYSTKKASKALLKKETYGSILNGTLSPENEKMLFDLGMIVSDTKDEKREVLGLLEKFNRKNTWLNISVILNLDCNFDCVYCYEGDMKGKLYMDDGTAGLLVDFVKGEFVRGKKSVNIDFYGGEPLLSAGLIKYISAEIKSIVGSRGGQYTFTLVTNGSLFKRCVAEKLVPLGLTGVKITVDGPSVVHNASRPFKSGAGSFDTIIRNIKETVDLLKISIGGNFQKGNYDQFPLLIEYLESEGLTPDRIYQLKFDAVMNRPNGEAAPADYLDGFMSANEPWVIEAGTILREKVLEKGYNMPKITPSPCQVELRDAYVVNFDGLVYKCPVFIGKKGYEIGTLRDGINDYSDKYKLGNWNNEECAECEYLPICFGGCRYMTYIRDGNIDGLDCKKPYLDAVLETLVKQDIKYGLEGNGNG